MNGPFLKFWGEFLLQAADGQRQVEELTQWMQSGFSPFVDLAALFRKCYGLAPEASKTADDHWQKVTSDFRETLEAYAPLWGWVPLDRYDQLKNENEHLKAQLDKQARLIKRLEALLADGDSGHMTMVTRFQDLIADQNKAFDELMQALVHAPEPSDEGQT